MHDTAERRPDFGVWKVWDEVRAGRPHAHVPYGHGLGILAVGAEVGAPFLEFLEALNTDARLVSQLEALGQRVQALCNNAASGEALHACQTIINQWLTMTGQPIRNPTPAIEHALAAPHSFAPAAVQDVLQMANDAVGLL